MTKEQLIMGNALDGLLTSLKEDSKRFAEIDGNRYNGSKIYLTISTIEPEISNFNRNDFLILDCHGKAKTVVSSEVIEKTFDELRYRFSMEISRAGKALREL